MNIKARKTFGSCLLLLLAAQQSSLFSAADARGFWDQKKCTEKRQELQLKSSWMRLKKSDSLESVLQDSEVSVALEDLLKGNLESYLEASKISELPGVNDDDLYAIARSRNANLKESFFNLNLQNRKITVLVLDGRTLSIYGAETYEQMPAPALEYLQDLHGRFGNTVNLAFKNHDTSQKLLSQKN